MGTLMIFTIAILICAVLVGWLFRKRTKRLQLPWLHLFPGATTRKLTDEERQGVENYLGDLNRDRQVPASGATIAPAALTLSAQSHTVFRLTRAITRYGITTDDPNKWRYFLDSVEVHLPPFWEQHITDENSIELIVTDDMPLVITLNGHSLKAYSQENRQFVLESSSSTQASIRGEESEQIELLNIRQETHEEHALSRPDGLREALLIAAAFLRKAALSMPWEGPRHAALGWPGQSRTPICDAPAQCRLHGRRCACRPL